METLPQVRNYEVSCNFTDLQWFVSRFFHIPAYKPSLKHNLNFLTSVLHGQFPDWPSLSPETYAGNREGLTKNRHLFAIRYTKKTTGTNIALKAFIKLLWHHKEVWNWKFKLVFLSSSEIGTGKVNLFGISNYR